MSRHSASRLSDHVAGGLSKALIVAGLAFLAVPLLVTALMAFDARTYLGPLPPPALSLHWFANLVSRDYIIPGLRVSLIVAVATTLFSVTAGTGAAIVLAGRNFPGRDTLASAFLSPLVVPPVVIGFGLLLFLSSIGVFDGLARLIVGHVVIALPYAIRASLGSLMGQDRRLTDAALVLGATERQAFRNVTLPLVRTGVVTGAVFAFATSMDDVSVSLFLSSPRATTLPVALLANMRADFDLTIAAAAVLLMAVTAALILILDRTVGFDRVLGQGLFRA